MSKRTSVTIAFIIVMLGSVLGIFCAIFILPPLVCYLDGMICLIAAFRVLLASNCPYCGKYKVIMNPLSSNRFHCKNCGREQPLYE